MTEESTTKASEESVTNVSAATRQRKKRKWDQPAESLISAGVAVPGVLPLNNMSTITGVTLPGVTPVFSSLMSNPMPSTYSAVPQVFQAPIQQTVASVVQKLNLPKIQDELIAREIVINDAEPSIRYKLTKRQTQEEIQRCTGAVVITRGKYHPPNTLNDSEKPLYLHISSGAHLKETAERIIAVDRAAAMVDEMLKPGLNSHPASAPLRSVVGMGGQVINQQLETCVYLGFETHPSLNIASRIRGPNDQYINHIMNETGATVLLRGRCSGNFETPRGQELQQPLHLYLSSNNPKSLEDAKLLAENLLDTISVECGASRVSSSKAYNAVPPPQQLLAGVQSSGIEQKENGGAVVALTSLPVCSTPVALQVSSATLSGVSCVYPQGSAPQNVGLFANGQPPPTMVSQPQPSLSGGTSYNGYGGIYPQATPLQQVALALRQSPSPVTSVIPPAISAASALPKPTSNPVTEIEKRRAQRRKFQELPVVANTPAKPQQVFSLTFYEADRPIQNLYVGSLVCMFHRFLNYRGAMKGSFAEWTSDQSFLRFSFIALTTHPFSNSLQGSENFKPGLVGRNISSMPPPKKLVQSSSYGMPPPPPPPSRTIPPPPPPKFKSPKLIPEANGENNLTKIKSTSEPSVPDTLIKLMEYGNEDDEDDEDDELRDGSSGEEEIQKINSKSVVAGAPKPFWAL